MNIVTGKVTGARHRIGRSYVFPRRHGFVFPCRRRKRGFVRGIADRSDGFAKGMDLDALAFDASGRWMPGKLENKLARGCCKRNSGGLVIMAPTRRSKPCSPAKRFSAVRVGSSSLSQAFSRERAATATSSCSGATIPPATETPITTGCNTAGGEYTEITGGGSYTIGSKPSARVSRAGVLAHGRGRVRAPRRISWRCPWGNVVGGPPV